MSNQIITLDLRRWIDEQTAAGVSDEAVLEAIAS